MGRFLFTTWDGGGNVPPVLALGASLQGRGHEVHVLGSASLLPRFANEGLDFTARPADREWDLRAQADEVLAAVERSEADVVVADYMLPGTLCGAAAAGRRSVALVHTLYRANRDQHGDLDPMAMAATVEGVNAARDALGLPPVARLGALLDEADRVMVTSPEVLDEPDDERPANVRYVGPVLLGPGVDTGWEPPPGDDPLVVASLGTTPMDELPVLQRLLDGLAERPVRVVVTVGDHLDPAELEAPANAVVTGHVRHAAVLPHAAVVVTHAGLGTVLAALTFGVPILAVPLGREQPANAAAVVRTGAGLALPPTASAIELGTAVDRLLAEPAFGEQAAALASTIAAHRDGCDAEALVEELLP